MMCSVSVLCNAILHSSLLKTVEIVLVVMVAHTRGVIKVCVRMGEGECVCMHVQLEKKDIVWMWNQQTTVHFISLKNYTVDIDH